MQKNLIALIAIAVFEDGKRKTIQPGEPVPALPPHDEADLLDAGAIQDLDDVIAQEAWSAEKEAAARALFDAARTRVAAEAASLAPGEEAGAGLQAQEAPGPAAPVAAPVAAPAIEQASAPEASPAAAPAEAKSAATRKRA